MGIGREPLATIHPAIEMAKNMTYITRDSEAGNEIERFATEEEAIAAVEAYEEEDRTNGDYTDGFYEVVEA